MSLKQQVLGALPPFGNKVRVIKQHQGTDDIMTEMANAHLKYAAQYDKIYTFFDTGDVYDTGKQIWNFLKQNLIYNAEKGKQQSVKSPSAILSDGQDVDCKHYSLFAGGVLDAIKHAYGEKWDWCYRFASEKDATSPTHVFVVVFDKGKEIWLDACLANYDQNKKYILEIDEFMALVEISGVGDAQSSPIVDVDKAEAWKSFMVVLALNLFGMTDLLRDNPQITNSQVKAYCQSMGFDFNNVLAYLQ